MSAPVSARRGRDRDDVAPAVTTRAPGLQGSAAPPARDQGFVARRVLMCGDHARGQITMAEHRERVAMLDAAWVAVRAAAGTRAGRDRVGLVRARRVIAVHRESLVRAAGARPAERLSERRRQQPGVGVARRGLRFRSGSRSRTRSRCRRAGPYLRDVLHPGAVSHVELITTSGAHIVAYDGAATVASEAARELHVDVADPRSRSRPCARR